MIEQDTIQLLRKCDDDKDPNPIAKGIAVISVFMEKEKVDNLLVEACQLILPFLITSDAASL